MNAFIQKVANYVANEVVIKGLANSRTFQRFAVRTNKSYTDFSSQSKDKLNTTIEDIVKQGTEGVGANNGGTTSGAAAAAAAGPPKPPLAGFPGFASAFGKELRKDITGG
jgi:malate/lactate dehydrogenase